MLPYRLQAPALASQEPPRRRGRALLIVLATVGLHVGVLAAAFAARAPEKTGSQTRIVSVLTGHVTELGDFQATGIADARLLMPRERREQAGPHGASEARDEGIRR